MKTNLRYSAASPKLVGILQAALVLAFILSGSNSLADKIYKTIDAEGNVVYTDIAPANQPEAAEFKVDPPNAFDPAASAESDWVSDSNVDPLTVESLTPDYETWITSPEPNEPVRNNAGDVTLIAEVNPELIPGHQLRFLVDGVAVGTSAGTQLQLKAMDRGTHKVKVEVINQDGEVLAESKSNTFHLQRFSKLFKKPAAPPP